MLGTHKRNMKALSITERNLWARLKCFKSRSKVMVKITIHNYFYCTIGKALPFRNTHAKYESPGLSLTITK